jgi:hypothetical protein
VVLGGVASFALVGSFVAGALIAAGTDTGASSTIDYSLTTTSSNYVQGPTGSFPQASGGNGTWEAWLYTTSNDPTYHAQFISKEISFVFARLNGVYQFAFGNGTSWNIAVGSTVWGSTGVTGSLNQWEHVAFVVTANSKIDFYLNGQLAYTSPLNNGFALGSSSSALNVGSRGGANGARQTGALPRRHDVELYRACHT